LSCPGDSAGITACLLAPCHISAGLRARLDAERLVLQCAICGWPVLVLAVHLPRGAGVGERRP
jgi:hypothetical protein